MGGRTAELGIAWQVPGTVSRTWHGRPASSVQRSARKRRSLDLALLAGGSDISWPSHAHAYRATLATPLPSSTAPAALVLFVAVSVVGPPIPLALHSALCGPPDPPGDPVPSPHPPSFSTEQLRPLLAGAVRFSSILPVLSPFSAREVVIDLSSP